MPGLWWVIYACHLLPVLTSQPAALFKLCVSQTSCFGRRWISSSLSSFSAIRSRITASPMQPGPCWERRSDWLKHWVCIRREASRIGPSTRNRKLNYYGTPLRLQCVPSNPSRSMTVWQDSLLSLCYDRPPIVSNMRWTPEALSSPRLELSYVNLMHYFCWVGLEIMKMEETAEPQPNHNLTLLTNLDSVFNRAQAHLFARENCINLQQHLEHLALRMHMSFIASALCRPAIKRSPGLLNEDPRLVSLRSRARENLITASRAFLDFQALSVVPLRTWSMVHTVLSSTLLLCTWQETREDAECRDLQQRVIEVFSGAGSGMETGSEYSQWLSARHIRALITLRQTLRKRTRAQDKDTTQNEQMHAVGPGQQAGDENMMSTGLSYSELFPGLDYG